MALHCVYGVFLKAVFLFVLKDLLILPYVCLSICASSLLQLKVTFYGEATSRGRINYDGSKGGSLVT